MKKLLILILIVIPSFGICQDNENLRLSIITSDSLFFFDSICYSGCLYIEYIIKKYNL